MGYNLLGRLVWYGGKLFLRHRYGDRPRKVGAALLVAGGIAAVLVAQRRQTP